MMFFTSRRLRRIERRLETMVKQMERVLKEIREAKTVHDGLRVANRQLRAALDHAETKLKEYDEDATLEAEAKKLLDEMESGEALAENTDGTFQPSGN